MWGCQEIADKGATFSGAQAIRFFSEIRGHDRSAVVVFEGVQGVGVRVSLSALGVE
jgi:hypothetical protein